MTPMSDAERAAMMRETRLDVARDTVTAAAGFPAYVVPEFVRERFPRFDPVDPSTWPEADRCTDGRPWGHSAYMYGATSDPKAVARGWREYFTGQAFRPCRNRWRYEDSHLCGVHDRPWREAKIRAEKTVRRNQRVESHLDLARRLSMFGVEADGSSAAGIILQADAVEGLLRILAEYDVAAL